MEAKKHFEWEIVRRWTNNKKVEYIEKLWGKHAMQSEYDKVTYKTIGEKRWLFGNGAKIDGIWILDIATAIICYNLHPTKDRQVLKNEDGQYFGYSHRSMQYFSIGDVLFDENWEIKEDHANYKKYLEKAAKAKAEDPRWYAGKVEEYVNDFIPFKERGYKIIENEEECYQAALNFAKYVS